MSALPDDATVSITVSKPLSSSIIFTWHVHPDEHIIAVHTTPGSNEKRTYQLCTSNGARVTSGLLKKISDNEIKPLPVLHWMPRWNNCTIMDRLPFDTKVDCSELLNCLEETQHSLAWMADTVVD